MNSFEKEYYEHESFWEGDMLHDENNARRMATTCSMIPASVNSLVDVGCGNGVFLKYLQVHKPGLRLMAADRSEMALRFVNTEKQVEDISKLSFSNQSFDCVTCLEVIEHLPQNIYRQSLAELARVAKDHVIISVPFEENLEESFNQCPNCRSIFSYEMHLRTFNETTMKELLNDHGFRCIGVRKEGPSVKFAGHYTFRKLFYRKQFYRWLSPICPICGYTQDRQSNNERAYVANSTEASAIKPKRSLLSYFTAIPKAIWPKKTKYYWIIGLYERVK
jgi:ubiquinone/menaquinone biosynthesis C-methylase UbiE